MKIDLQKAYDTVNWNFLGNILKGFGFHEKMIKWIMNCVTTTPFSILTTYNVDLVKGEKWKTEFSVNPHFALLYYKGERK